MDNSDDFWDLPAAPEDTYETTVLPTTDDEPAPEVEKKRNARTVILGSITLALVIIVALMAAIGIKNWSQKPATEETTASTPQATIAPTIPTQDATIAPQATPTPQAAATTPTAPSTQPAPAVIDPDTLTFASVKQAREPSHTSSRRASTTPTSQAPSSTSSTVSIRTVASLSSANERRTHHEAST